MSLDSKKKLSTSAMIFIIAAIALLYCPFFNIKLIGYGYSGDTMIQTRIGLDTLAQGRLITEDIYSWHQDLNWWSHETGWCILVGIFYRLFGLIGIIGLTSIFNYLMAGIIFKKNLKTVHPLIMVLTAAIGRFLSFPNYNARPHLSSQLLFLIFVYAMLDEKISIRKRCLLFSLFSFLLAWFHGGMIPLFFVVFLVFIVIEAVYKNFRVCGYYLIGLLAGFVSSLLSPIGIGTWTYAWLQSRASDVWVNNVEWQPKTFSIPEITIILIVLAGFAVDKRFRDFDKKVITRFCFYCMFIILSCKYCRFMNFTALVIVMFCAEEIQILLSWLNDRIARIDTKIFDFSDVSYYILTAFCAGFMLYTSIFSWIRYFPTNSMSDISGIAAYDEGVIDYLKDKDYERIYNSFNSGTWLAFYQIPVHIDNRTDLYLEEFSGEDYITGTMMINNISDMDDFVDKYDADAIVLDLAPGTTDEYFIDDLYASEKYRIVYDNTAVSTYDADISCRWVIAECIR